MRTILLVVICLLMSQLSVKALTNVSGTIGANTTWTLAGSPYVVTSTVTVNAGVTLTIQPGVVVKYGSTTYSSNMLIVNGTLLAQGTTAQPIVFTDNEDSAYGGSGFPNQGYEWKSIQIKATSGNTSVFSHCEIRYGGYDKFSALDCQGSSPFISNCHFFKCKDALAITQGSTAVVNNNVFEQDNSMPIRISYDVTPNFANNTFIDNQINGLGITGTTNIGNYTLSPTNVAGIENIPYVIEDTIVIAQGSSLTIEPGVIFKYSDNFVPTVQVNGTLIAQGTAAQPIVVTTIRDDEYGGDTNNDPISPFANGTLIVNSSSSNTSIFSHCLFRYTGYSNYIGMAGAIQCVGSSPTISDCHFLLCKSGLGVLDGATPTVTNNLFEQHTLAPINISYDIVPNFASNTFTNNAMQAIGLLTTNLVGNYTLNQINVGSIENVPYLIYNGYRLTIPVRYFTYHCTGHHP